MESYTPEEMAVYEQQSQTSYTPEEMAAASPQQEQTSFTPEEMAAYEQPQQGLRPRAAGMQPAPQKERSWYGEIGMGLKRGAAGYLPEMLGQATKWATDNAYGQTLVNKGEEYLSRAENQLHEDAHNVITNTLAKGAEMLVQSVAPAAAVGAAVAALPEAVAGGAIGLGLTALGGAIPMGMSQAQQTYESVKAAGKSEEEAIAAGRKSGAIEALGETLGTYIGGKFVGLGAKAIGLSPAKGLSGIVADVTNPDIAKPFFSNLVKTAIGETATEMGQSYGEAYVEQQAGVDVDPMEQAVGAIQPTIGMTALLAPFGLHANYRQSKAAKAVDTALNDTTNTPAATRTEVVNALYDQAVQSGVPEQEAQQWLDGAMFDIENELPVRRSVEASPEAQTIIDAQEEQYARQNFVGGNSEYSAVTDEDLEAGLFASEVRQYNRERNRAITPEEKAYNEYQPAVPGDESAAAKQDTGTVNQVEEGRADRLSQQQREMPAEGEGQLVENGRSKRFSDINDTIEYQEQSGGLHHFRFELPNGEKANFSSLTLDPAEVQQRYEKVKAGFEKVTSKSPAVQFSMRTDEEVAGELSKPQQKVLQKLQQSGILKTLTPDEANGVLTEAGSAEALSSVKEAVQGFRIQGQDVAHIVPQNIQKGNVWGVVRHEVGVHLNRLSVQDKQFKNILNSLATRKADQGRTGEAIRNAMAAADNANVAPEQYWEEVLGYLVEKGEKTSVVRKVVAWVKTQLNKIGLDAKAFSNEDLVAMAEMAVRGGRRKGAAAAQTEQGGDAQFSLLSGLFKKREQQNTDQQGGSQFRPVDTASKAFKKWFGKSKVVNSDGSPMVVYHGSPAATFEGFDIEKTGLNSDSGYLGEGAYFTNDPAVASLYSKPTQGSPNAAIYPVYLSMQNPLIIQGKVNGVRGLIEKGERMPFGVTDKALKKIDTPFSVIKAKQGYYKENPIPGLEEKLSKAVSEVLKEEGYDGVIARDESGYVEYMVPKSTQIKSAVSNTGGFSPTDARIQFSLVSDNLKSYKTQVDTGLKTLADPKAAGRDAYVHIAPTLLSVTPLQTLVETFYKGRTNLLKWAERIRKVGTTSKDIVDTAGDLYNAIDETFKTQAERDAFNLAAGTASFNRMTPWMDKAEQEWVSKKDREYIKETKDWSKGLENARKEWVDTGMKEATGKTYDQAWKESKLAYDALSDKTKEAYKDLVKFLSILRRREYNNLVSFIEKTTITDPALRATLMARAENTFKSIKGAYMPLVRFGDHRLEYVDKESGQQVIQFFETPHKRTAAKKIVEIEQGPTAFIEDNKDHSTKSTSAIPMQMMQQLQETVMADYMKGVDPTDSDAITRATEQAQNVMHDMNQIWLRWQPETSALKSSIQRKNKRGFDQDMLRGFLQYSQKHAGSIAWAEVGRELETLRDSFETEINEKVKGAREKGTAADVSMDRILLNDMRAREHALRTARVGKIASTAGKFATAWYMTSPSIALVQMSQLGIFTMPKLAVKYGLGSSSKAMKNGLAASFSKKFTRSPMLKNKAVGEVFDSLKAKVTVDNKDSEQAKGKLVGDYLYSKDEILEQISKLSKYERQLLILREAMSRNLLDISAAHEVQDIVMNSDSQGLGKKLFDLAMKPMALSELASRKATIIATAELAEAKGHDFFKAMNDVAEVVDETLFNYGKEGKGSAMMGGGARVFLQFQHFRIMAALRLALMGRTALKGVYSGLRGKGIDANEKEAIQEFTGIMAMSGLLAGTLGMPMINTVFGALNLAFGGDDEDPYDAKTEFAAWLRRGGTKQFADVIETGLPAAFGLDLSRRIGLGDTFGITQAEPPPWLHGKELTAWWAATLLGPAFAAGASIVDGYDEMVNKGNFERGLEKAMPKPIRDVMRAYRMSTEGLRTGAGRKMLEDGEIGPEEVMMISLGFNPSEISKVQRAESSLLKMKAEVSAKRGRIISDVVKALSGDGNIDAAREAWLKFNTSMPGAAIKSGEVRTAFRKGLKGEQGITSQRDRYLADRYEIPVFRD